MPACILLDLYASRSSRPIVHLHVCVNDFADKGLSSQSYGFSSSILQCESWNIKKAESQRNDDFELWCWKRPVRVP